MADASGFELSVLIPTFWASRELIRPTVRSTAAKSNLLNMISFVLDSRTTDITGEGTVVPNLVSPTKVGLFYF